MKNRKLSYVYSFDCGEEIEHFDKLSDETQKQIEHDIVGVICESFITPADEDYLTARLLAQNGLHRAFYWAASQALEKYLKAFLLMRGVSVNRTKFKGHPILELYEEAVKEKCQLRHIDISPHTKIKINSKVDDVFTSIKIDEFLRDIQSHGSPDNRYNSFGVQYTTAHLFALDSFVFALRSEIGVPDLSESLKEMNQELNEAFHFYNPWFSPNGENLEAIPNSEFNLEMSDAVTTLERLTGDHSPFGAKHALRWLSGKMKLPQKVKKSLQ